MELARQIRDRIQSGRPAGAVSLQTVGPVVDTLPAGAVFGGATPPAGCEPGCVGTTPATVSWTSPCIVPLAPGASCDISLNVTFPSGILASGTNVTNSLTARGTPVGEGLQPLGTAQTTHPVTTFEPNPSATLVKNLAAGSPNPPVLNQTFSYDLAVGNNGNVVLDNTVVIDALPAEMQVSVTTGAYSALDDFAAGEGVRVSYKKNTALGVFSLWGSSPNPTTNTTLTAPPPGLGAGEYLTRIRWEYGQAQPGMTPTSRPLITGRIINPDHAGGSVSPGDAIQNCAALSAVFTDGPTNVTRNDCETFALGSSLFQVNPAAGTVPASGGQPRETAGRNSSLAGP
jgi:large repetitive protein